MLVTFIPYFNSFSVGLYLKITFFMVYDEKNCCFSTFAQKKPNQDKPTRFSSSSVRRPKKAGEVRDDMSTSLDKPSQGDKLTTV